MNAFAAGDQAPRTAFFRRGMEQTRIPRQRSRDGAPIREIDSQDITGHGSCRRKGHADHLAQTSWTGNASRNRVHSLREMTLLCYDIWQEESVTWTCRTP